MSGRPAERIEPLLEEIQQKVDPDVFARVEELVRCIVALYGEGLERIPALLAEEDAGSALWRRLASDDRIAGLLVLHGLHPEALAERVERGLAKVRPYLGSHGGDVHLVSVDERTGLVRLRLDGSCDGCPASSATLQLAVAGAIRAEAPEVTDIAVEGPGREPLLQVETRSEASQWLSVEPLFDEIESGVRSREVAGGRVLLCRVAGDAFAYRDRCAGCGESLAGGKLEGDWLACTSCGQQYDLRRAGSNRSGGDPLDPLPLLERDGALQIAVAKA